MGPQMRKASGSPASTRSLLIRDAVKVGGMLIWRGGRLHLWAAPAPRPPADRPADRPPATWGSPDSGFRRPALAQISKFNDAVQAH